MTDIDRIRRAQIEAAENMVVASLPPELRAEPRDARRGGSSYEASMLRNLLAVIHRDGGHYVEQHGLDKALEDAEAKVMQWLARDDALGVPDTEPKCPKCGLPQSECDFQRDFPDPDVDGVQGDGNG